MLRDPKHLSTTDKDSIWDAGCRTLFAGAAAGRSSAECKRIIATWLYQELPALGASEAALIWTLERKARLWDPANGIEDLRGKANQQKCTAKLSKADFDELVGRAVPRPSGGLDAAWRHCLFEKKFSPAILKRYEIKPGAWPRCPKAIRQKIRAAVKAARDQYVRPGWTKSNSASISRDWSKVAPGDYHTADDCTPPIYFYTPDGHGWWRLIRGQFLPMIDCRSKKILDFVLVNAESYTGADIRSLIMKACDRAGLPHKGYHFENGIWRRCKFVGGPVDAEWNENDLCQAFVKRVNRETFAGRLGLEIIYAESRNPRTKVVENLLLGFQNLLEGEAGFVGGNEMLVRYERVQAAILDVKAKRCHPAEAGFFSAEEWRKRLEEKCQEYNSTPQLSKIMGGDRKVRMTPSRAYEQLWGRDANGELVPVTKLQGDYRYLLAHKEVVRVTRNGISIQSGKYRYLGKATGELVGEKVIAFFDPTRPESISITDLKGENLQTVERLDDVPAFDATPEQLRKAKHAIKAHRDFGRRLYSELKSKFEPPVRPVIADSQSVEKGREMENQRAQLLEQKKQEHSERNYRAARFRDVQQLIQNPEEDQI